MRLGDVLDLKRSDVRGPSLVIADPKAGEPYVVPMSARVRAALAALPRSDSPWLFPSRRRAKTAHDRSGTIRQVLARACAELDIPYGRAVNGLTFHRATRHTGASRMIDAGSDLRTVQDLGNWSDIRMLERYGHPADARKQAAVESVSRSQSVPTRRRRR